MYNVLEDIKVEENVFVFEKALGEPYKDIKTAFNAAKRRAVIEDLRFHDLRHTFASHLVMEGVPLSTVGKLLGHKMPEMTWRYAHLSPEYMDKTVGLLHKINTTPGEPKRRET